MGNLNLCLIFSSELEADEGLLIESNSSIFGVWEHHVTMKTTDFRTYRQRPIA